jgi:RNA polymerase sigma-70 factor (ECF subfamily)
MRGILTDTAGGLRQEMPENDVSMEAFLMSLEKRAFRMARFATGNTDDALDIVQDAMYALVSRYADKAAAQWRPLFFRILVNRIRDWYRRQKVRRYWQYFLHPLRKEGDDSCDDPIESVPDETMLDPSEQLVLNDTVTTLDNALRRLPSRQQQAFLLRAWEGLSVRDTAKAMKCSEGSIKTHYARAIRTLRHLLENHWQ